METASFYSNRIGSNGGDVDREAPSLEFDKYNSPVSASWAVEGDCTDLVAQKYVPGGMVFRPVRCHSWSCPRCGYTRASWLKRQIANAVRDHGLSRFATLTLSGRLVAQADSERRLKWAWGRLRKSLHERYPVLQYVWVMEFTEAGQAHLHLLLNTYIPQRQLSALWKEASGGSYVVDIRWVGSTAAARYIAKYVGKEAGRRRAAGSRRVNAHLFDHSSGIVFEPYRRRSQGWVVMKGTVAEWQTFLTEGDGRPGVSFVSKGSGLEVQVSDPSRPKGLYPTIPWGPSRIADPTRESDW